MVEIQEIVDASNKKNGGKEGANKYTLNSMKEHAKEIEELFLKKDEHWEAECADMMIHCLCLFKREEIGEMKVLELGEKEGEIFGKD